MTFLRELEDLAAAMKQALASARSAEELSRIEKDYLGRNGSLTAHIKTLPNAAASDRPQFGRTANAVKQELVQMVVQRKRELGGGAASFFDVTLPGIPVQKGHIHPLTHTLRKLTDIFRSMGFEVVDGPEVETERYNFDLLNIPPQHPARDAQDTFYVRGSGRVLRTHTSPVQLRAMETRKPPVRLIAPGRVYRHEATDASHEAAFYQCEGLVIDEHIRLTDLFGTIDDFLKAFFGNDVRTRAQASFFPFVEPGAEISMSCLICKGKGCSVCKHSGWLEMMGCGMVHPTVLKNMKVDPKKFSGFAFGMGVDRLMMLSMGIHDIRLAYGGDLRFLEQF